VRRTAAAVVAGVGAAHQQQRRDPVALGELVEHLDVEVRERLADHPDPAPERVGPRGRVEDDRVVGDDVGRDELVHHLEVALVEALFIEPADEGLVGLECVGHRRIVCADMRRERDQP